MKKKSSKVGTEEANNRGEASPNRSGGQGRNWDPWGEPVACLGMVHYLLSTTFPQERQATSEGR